MIQPASPYARVLAGMQEMPATWLVTGAAGFIGSHLVQTLLRCGQQVRGLDNFQTGSQANLDHVRAGVGQAAWANFSFHRGDIRYLELCMNLCEGVDFVLHEAALGSVPLSLEAPLFVHEVNITGFLNVLQAARMRKVRRLVFATSSASYGDCADVPAVEDRIGDQLSPYALSKYVDELYARVFQRVYKTPSVGLRYFNVFGPRQDPNGPYAAVIPKWTQAILDGHPVFVNGDGHSTRDFCYVDNVVQANLLAAYGPEEIDGQIFNVAAGKSTDLLSLYGLISGMLERHGITINDRPKHRAALPGEVRHSQADIGKIQKALGYAPAQCLADDLDKAIAWYVQAHRAV